MTSNMEFFLVGQVTGFLLAVGCVGLFPRPKHSRLATLLTWSYIAMVLLYCVVAVCLKTS